MNRKSIEFVDLSFSYAGKRILDGINLRIEGGELFSLLGPSGSGKTTLLRLITGFDRPGQGDILLDDVSLADQAAWQRNIGMVFQNYALWPHMTVWDNVAFGLVERRLSRAAIESRVRNILETLGLIDVAASLPHQLSGGQQQRTALARALVIEPEMLLLDEPFSNVEPGLRIKMRNELMQLQRRLGITTILVTHDRADAMSIADRMAIMNRGRIEQVGTPSAIYDFPVSPFVAEFAGTVNFIHGELVAEKAGKIVFNSPQIGMITFHAFPGATSEARSGVLCFRPQAPSLILFDEFRDGRYTWLEGEVNGHEFYGNRIRYQIQVGTDVIMVDRPHLFGSMPLGRGCAVCVGLDPMQTMFLAVRDIPAVMSPNKGGAQA